MKNIFIGFLFLLIIICTGCGMSQEYKDFLLNVEDYMNSNGQTCLEYVKNDKNLVERDKEVYRARHRMLRESLNRVKK